MSDSNSNPAPNPVPPRLGPPGGASTQTCIECGKIFSADQMIRHGDSYVCANCKPIFMQKLAEGARLDPNDVRYAGFWIRFAAVFVDGIILRIFGTIIGLVIGLSFAATQGASTSPFSALQVVAALVGLVVALGYEVFFIGKFGATPGKMMCRIKVVTAEGEPVTYLRALARWASKLVSSLTLMIGYIMAGFDPEKRALHDRICNTRVIYK